MAIGDCTARALSGRPSCACDSLVLGCWKMSASLNNNDMEKRKEDSERKVGPSLARSHKRVLGECRIRRPEAVMGCAGNLCGVR